MAWAKKIKHEPGLVVAVIGDGAFTGGMVYEGMNNIGGLDNLLVILNDNKMSISKNVGALARYLTHLRTTTAYYDAKDNVRSFLDGVPLIGTPMKKSLIGAKTLVRRAMYHSTMFEDMGFEYIGPVDGHNVEELERTLRSIYQRPGPHFLHIVTKKGKGYQPAEMNPGNYHGVSAFDPDGMPDPEVAPKESFSTVFGKLLVQEGTQNPKLCAITAAMKYGTGLQFFAHRHPQRFFDVGMAEQHAVTFAAGLASQGMLPVVCIYSTFLQRSYDQIIHDLSIEQQHVVIGIDRATFTVEGKDAFGMLRAEAGVHRLVRISPTDDKKRRQTTFAGVEVIPVLPDDIDIEISPDDIRVDVYHASGPGGQGVNTTDSAVRVTHFPSGIVVTCQNERSQIQNKAACMQILKARLYEIELEKRAEALDEIRGPKTTIGFGNQIRSYVLYPYQMVKDLRTGVETSNVEAVLDDGDLDPFVIGYHRWATGNADAEGSEI